jgi:1-acyl-sn-glycerol-3-phosphate acyltransferase
MDTVATPQRNAPQGQKVSRPGEAALLETVSGLLSELRAGASPPPVELDSNLERDLGLDSLERAELLLRLERVFGARLPVRTLATAETSRDLLRAVLAGAATRGPPAAVPAEVPITAGAASIPHEAATLVDVLTWHARAYPQRNHLTLLIEDEAGPQAQSMSYGQLYAEAGRVASSLVLRGLEAGQAVAIMLPTCREFFSTFFGILLAGGVPVPIYPPARRSQLEEHLRRQSGILANSLAAWLVTVPEARPAARLLRATTPSLKHIVAPADLDGMGSITPRTVGERDIAFLQYTSGSTGSPKGVVLTHGNILANIRAMGRAVSVRPDDVFVSWLPLYHDMGLIGAWFGTLYYAIPLVVMPPTDFLARPESWLRAMQHYRGTISAGPNFAYEMCATRLDAERLEGLDLSSWRIAFNGSEPVSAETVTRFAERFAPYGFDPSAHTPVYGLAEAAVGLAFPPLHRRPVIDRVDRSELARTGRAAPAAVDDRNALRLVACGRPIPGHQIRVVDPAGRELPERMEGRVEFRGPSATSGYFRNPEATRALFRGNWLDTGDLGYVGGGELYLTGRAKDLIIRAGQHVHPAEAEAAIGGIPGIRKGCVTVFGVPDPASGTEKVVVIAETRETDPLKTEDLRRKITELVAALLGAPPDDVVLAPPHAVLKTSSGKLRRSACRELYQRGMRGAGPRAWRIQLLRLAWAGAKASARHAVARMGELLFGAYTWALLGLIGLVALVAVIVLPRLDWRRSVLMKLARAFVAMSGLAVRVTGVEHFAASGPITVVANHASYLDGIVLLAMLPARCLFVAKRELNKYLVTRLLLSGIGARYVERFDIEGSVEAGEELSALSVRGESLVFFAEGTLRRDPGLRPFHMGAFLGASRSASPVVPVTIRGTRSVLRDGQWLPRRGVIQIVVSPAVHPVGSDWSAAVRLRDEVRSAILANCGEPDLAGAA